MRGLWLGPMALRGYTFLEAVWVLGLTAFILLLSWNGLNLLHRFSVLKTRWTLEHVLFDARSQAELSCGGLWQLCLSPMGEDTLLQLSGPLLDRHRLIGEYVLKKIQLTWKGFGRHACPEVWGGVLPRFSNGFFDMKASGEHRRWVLSKEGRLREGAIV